MATPTPTTPTTPTKPVANHKASLVSALTALGGSGATIGALLAFTNAHLPGVQSALTAVAVAVATFVARYLPYVKKALSFWHQVRKQKAVQPYVDAALAAYKAQQTTATLAPAAATTPAPAPAAPVATSTSATPAA